MILLFVFFTGILASCDIDGVVFTKAGPVKFALPVKEENGTLGPAYLWQFSPCSPAADLCPKLSHGYVQYRPHDGCLSNSSVFPNSTYQPFIVGDAGNDALFKYWNFDNDTKTTTDVEIAVKCFPLGPPDAIIADPDAAYASFSRLAADHVKYSLRLLSRCACSGGCGEPLLTPNADCVIGDMDFSDTERVTFALPQQGRQYNWTISLCTPVPTPSCVGPSGFIQRSDCHTWAQTISIASTSSAGIFTFGAANADMAVVSVACDPLRERGTLQLANGVTDVPSPPAFSLTSRCACPGACPRGRDYWHRGQSQVATSVGAVLEYPEGYPGREFQSGHFIGVNLSPRQCGRACDATSGCDSFLYNSDDGSCQLQSSASCQVSTPSAGPLNATTYWLATTGPCPRQLYSLRHAVSRGSLLFSLGQCNTETDTALEGDDIGAIQVSSVELCCTLCVDTGSACLGFTYTTATSTCTLKGSIRSSNASTGHTSGRPGPPSPSPSPPPTPPPSPPPLTCQVDGKYFADVALTRFSLPLEHDGVPTGVVEWEVSLCSPSADLCPEQQDYVQMRFANGTCATGFSHNTLMAAGDSGATFMYTDPQQQSTLVVEVKCDPLGQRFNLHPQATVAVANGSVPVYRVTLASRCACTGACGASPPPDNNRDCGIGQASFASVPPVQLNLPLSLAGGKPVPGFTWGVSLCANSSALCPDSQPGLVQRRADNTSLCTSSGSGSVEMDQLRSISAVSGDTTVFVMSSSDGSQVAIVQVRCDPNGDATLRTDPDSNGAVASPDGQHYHFNLTSRCACASGCVEGARQYWSKALHQYSVYPGTPVQYPAGFPNRASFNGTLYGKGITLLQCEQACDYAAQCDSLSMSGDGSKGDCFLFQAAQTCDTYTSGSTTTYWLQVGGACPKPDAQKSPLSPARPTVAPRASTLADYDPGCAIDDIDFRDAGSVRFVLPLRAGNESLGNFLWYVNPCKATSDLCPEWPQAFVQYKKPDAACGGADTSFVNRTDLVVAEGGNGVTFSFQSVLPGGNNVTAQVAVRCNPHGPVEVVEPDPLADAVTLTGPANALTYTIPLQSRCACPGQCGRPPLPINPTCSVGGADFSSVVPLQARYDMSDGSTGPMDWVFSPCVPTPQLCTSSVYIQKDDCDSGTAFTESLAMASTAANVTLFTFRAEGSGLFTMRIECDPSGERSVISVDPLYDTIDVRGQPPNVMYAVNVTSRCACPGGCPAARAYWHRGHGQISDPEGQDVPYPLGYPGRTPFGNSFYGLMVSKEQCARACDATALGSPSTLPCNGFTWSQEINGTCWLKHAASCSTKSAGAAGWSSYWLVDGAPCPRQIPAALLELAPPGPATSPVPRDSPLRSSAPTCNSEPGMLYTGDVLGSISAPLSSCCTLCSEIAGCQGFSYDVTIRRCDLKTNISTSQLAANVTSGRIRPYPVSCSVAGLHFDNVGPVRFHAAKPGSPTPALWEVSLCSTTTELCPTAVPGHLLERDPDRNCSQNTFPELAFFASDPNGALFIFDQPNVGSARIRVQCDANGVRDVLVPTGPVNISGEAPRLLYDITMTSLCACPGACGPIPVMPSVLDCAVDSKYFWPMAPALFTAPVKLDMAQPGSEQFTWSFSPCSPSDALCPGTAARLAQRRDNTSACTGLAAFNNTVAMAANASTTIFHLTGDGANATVTVTCDSSLPPFAAFIDPSAPNVTIAGGNVAVRLVSACACADRCKPPVRNYWSQGDNSLSSDQGQPQDYPSSFPGRFMQNGTWCGRGVNLQDCKRACDFLAPDCDSFSWGVGTGLCSLWQGSSCSTFTSSNGLSTYWLDDGRCVQPSSVLKGIPVV